MSYGVGALDVVTLSNLSTSGRKCVSKREGGSRLRNQKRPLTVISIKRDDGTVKARGIRDGQLAHYKAAYYFADVEYMLGVNGKRIKLPARRKA